MLMSDWLSWSAQFIAEHWGVLDLFLVVLGLIMFGIALDGIQMRFELPDFLCQCV